MTLPITVTVETPVAEPARSPLWMVREDRDLFGSIRPCAPCPAVVVLTEDPHAVMSEQWQYYLDAINYTMELEDVYLVLDWQLAFANGTGFRKPGSPRADYFHRRDLSSKPPSLDKVRSCVRNIVTGTPTYSVTQAVKEAATLVKGLVMRQQSVLGFHASFSALSTNNVLNVWTFDSRQPPPLRPGRSYPSRVEDADPDDYLYLPQTDREKFLVANIVAKDGHVSQFPRGGLYSWTGDHTPYSFVPHVSNHGYGEVLFPLKNLVSIPVDAPIPSPYRSNE